MIEKNNTIKRSNSKNRLLYLIPKKSVVNTKCDDNVDLNNNEIQSDVIEVLTNELSNSLSDVVEDNNKIVFFELDKMNISHDDYIFKNTVLILISGIFNKIKNTNNTIVVHNSDTKIQENKSLDLKKIMYQWIIPFIIQSIIRDIVSITFHNFLSKLHEIQTNIVHLPINQ